MIIYLPRSHPSAFSLFLNTPWFFLPVTLTIILNAANMKKSSPTMAINLTYERLKAVIDCMILIRSLLMYVPVTSSKAMRVTIL